MKTNLSAKASLALLCLSLILFPSCQNDDIVLPVCLPTPTDSCLPLERPITNELIVELLPGYTADEIFNPKNCLLDLFLFQLGTDFLGVHPDSIKIINPKPKRQCNCNLMLLEVELPEGVDINDGKVGSMSPPEDQSDGSAGIIASVGFNHHINIGPVNAPYDSMVINQQDNSCVVYYRNQEQLDSILRSNPNCTPVLWDPPLSSGEREQLTVVAGIDTGTDPAHDYGRQDPEEIIFYSTEEVTGNNVILASPQFGQSIPLNGIDDDGDCVEDDIWGMDYFHADNNPVDRKGHGTHIAGTILTGRLSTSSGIRLMTLQIGGYLGDTLDQAHFRCDLFSILCALDYAVQNEADIVNMSLGYYAPHFNPPFYRQVRKAKEAGILMVTSLGNDGVNVDSCAHWPSNFSALFPDHVIAVAALDTFSAATTAYTLASYSNYGQHADLAAPGTLITSAEAGSGNGYVQLSGTSMAAAVVSRRAAIIRDSVIQAGGTITAAQIKAQIIQETGPSSANICVSGGRVLTHLNDTTLLSAIGY